MPFCLAVSSVKYNSTNNSIEFGNSGSMPGRNRNSGEPCDEKNYYSPPPLRDRVPHLLSRLSISRSTPVAREHLPPSINQTQRKNRRAASFKNEKVINAKGGRALRGELRNHRAAIVDECVRVCKREREREKGRGDSVWNPENPTLYTKATSHWIWTWTWPRLSKNFSPH